MLGTSPSPAHPLTSQATRRRSWLLLFALVPMLTYFGHWPGVRVEVPALNGYWQLPFTGDHHAAPAHNHHGHDHASSSAAAPLDNHGAHAQHCHTDMGSCLNTTGASFVAFALLAAAVAFLGLADIARPMTSRAWAPVREVALGPEAPPPRLRAAG